VAAVWEQRWAEFVRRYMGLRESSALDAAPELLPVLVVNEPGAPESRLARRERSWEGSHAVAGGATFAGIQLNNAKGASTERNLVTIDKLVVRCSVVGFVNLTVAYAPDNQAAGNVEPTDTRAAASVLVPKAKLEGATRGAVAAAAASYSLPVANTDYEIPAGYVLAPGTQLYIVASAVGTTITANVRWSERDVDPSELTPTGA
jgi:hypothetical protein